LGSRRPIRSFTRSQLCSLPVDQPLVKIHALFQLRDPLFQCANRLRCRPR
jgi:hypothetical protein